MQNKLQEITDKIYREGLEKGQSEADKIVSDAKAQSNQIISDAKERLNILSLRQKRDRGDEKQYRVGTETICYTGFRGVKTEIVNLVTDKLATSNVKAATEDKEFMQKLIIDLVQNWAKNEALTVGVANPEELKSRLQPMLNTC